MAAIKKTTNVTEIPPVSIKVFFLKKGLKKVYKKRKKFEEMKTYQSLEEGF